MARNFTHRLATRDKTPLLVGLVGPSSSGKTYSALELATGFQRVNQGEIFLIDTEAGRSKQYADRFKFQHIAFGAPFSPLDYLEVIKYCVDQGATNIIIDSLSHEHEGPGGVLEWHAAEMGGNYSKQMLAWAKPKAARRRLINTIMQLNVNFVFCFRAKEKLKLPPKGSTEQPVNMGFQPIGGDEWIYEMTLNMLLLPRANGVPAWQSEREGEKAILKLPKQFEDVFSSKPQLSRDVGEKLARWAAGTSAVPTWDAARLVTEYGLCDEPSRFRDISAIHVASWMKLDEADKPGVKAARAACEKRLDDATKAPEISAPVDDEPFTQTAAAAS
jgi:ABC-type dipeptide/oligopeptide/nickel transport system ATPase subunit